MHTARTLRWLPIFLLCLAAGGGCKKDKKLFRLLDSRTTGIAFANTITEADTLSIINSEFIYNGGGVAVGDLNGDGLPDLYFTGNQVDNKLYINRGGLRFEDATERARAQKRPGQWSASATILDINRDGKQDIYVCNTFWSDPRLRQNLLFINQGNDAAGIPQFAEMAAEFGIASDTHDSAAQFFDYDNDGDLDLFLAVNFMDARLPNRYIPRPTDGSSPNTDRLFRNDWDEKLGHPVFTDISRAAGILHDGYSHSVLAADFNSDGWLDIYVANDYVTNDLLYLNNQNGTFTNEIARIFKHQALSAMGSDVADANNDGRLDIFTTEMLPYYNKRKKLFLNANNYVTYLNNDEFGYEYQFGHNVLQINAGNDPLTGLPVFSDVAFLGNVQETEWSWTPLMADLDNDGNRDIFITNGFPRDVTDHDFGAYRSGVSNLIAPMDLQAMIPQIKVPKFAFRNAGDLRFEDVSARWGVDVPGFTNGAATVDLDGDGDLDLVANNIDDPAFVFENTLNEAPERPNFLRLKLQGEPANPDAFGAEVSIFWDGKRQAAQTISGRGYLSASENVLHFGLGSATAVDSVVVKMRGQRAAVLVQPPLNQTITAKIQPLGAAAPAAAASAGFFENADPARLGLRFVHRDTDFVDFNYQKTIPHKFSQFGPSISVGDANGDGLDDVYLGGSTWLPGTWFWQKTGGTFVREDVSYKGDSLRRAEEMGTLLFDADGDGDLDLYLAHGGAQLDPADPHYQDLLWVNDGRGHFSPAPTGALPAETANGQAVKATDFDGDGDLDLFVGGRVLPQNFPKPDRSFLLRNDAQGRDQPRFTDVTAEIAPELAQIGMISDALWTDFDNDNDPDLLLAGEWMPLIFLKNEAGKFNRSSSIAIPKSEGWWTSLAAADFDRDGDMDYVAGNYGENVYFKGSPAEPLRVWAGDFDNNGYLDPFISCYWRDSLGRRREFFYHTRDDMVKQVNKIRRKFLTYGALGEATAQEVFSTKEELAGSWIMEAVQMASCFVENLGGGQFRLQPLPTAAQVAPVFGMLPFDADNDGWLDLLMVGNDYGMELLQGRADAFNGLILKNLGKNQFAPVPLNESKFFVPGDGKTLARAALADGRELILAGQNKGALRAFLPNRRAAKTVRPQSGEVRAVLEFADGSRELREFYWGNSFLSQTSSSLSIGADVRRILFFDRAGKQVRSE